MHGTVLDALYNVGGVERFFVPPVFAQLGNDNPVFLEAVV